MKRAGKHQKSPHTQRIAAPICWSATRFNVITGIDMPGIDPMPSIAAPKLYKGTDVKKLRMMAITVMMRFVANKAPACPKGERVGRKGAEGMNWNQNSSPERKNVDSITPM